MLGYLFRILENFFTVKFHSLILSLFDFLKIDFRVKNL